MTKVFLVLVWFLSTFAVLAGSLGLIHIKKTKNFAQGVVSSAEFVSQGSPYNLFSALPSQIGDLTNSVVTGDARPLILKNFLEQNNSPLVPYTNLFVETADKYGLDFRLIPAISMVESTGGKVIPFNSFNAWGFANGESRFISWETAIDKVGKTLKEDYIDKGLVTPEQIMPKYAPPSVEKGGPWAKGVNFFLQILE